MSETFSNCLKKLKILEDFENFSIFGWKEAGCKAENVARYIAIYPAVNVVGYPVGNIAGYPVEIWISHIWTMWKISCKPNMYIQ